MLKINHLFMLTALAAGCMLAGCSDDYPSATENPYANDLLSIKILNSGAEGNIEVEGTIDEDAKTIKFPKLDKESDFANLKISATMSDGASLDPATDVLDFSMDEATTQVTKLLRVKNHNRYKDYFMTVRKRVPVFGANFEQGTEICNFTGTSIYKYIASAQTRCTAFDGKYVLICYRNPTADDPSAPGAHLLKVSDLEQGTSQIAGAANRHGDVMSLNLDKDGNGFVFFPSNDYSETLRIPISNFKNVGTPASIELQSDNKAGMCMHINRIEGTDDYILSGARVNLLGSTGKLSGMNLALCDEGLNSKIRLNTNTVAAESDDARLFSFNGARYLLTAPVQFGSTSSATPGMHVYDLTKGGNTQEAFQLFNDAESHAAAYSLLIGGSGLISPGINTNYYVEKDADGNDSVLWLYVGRTETGFAIMKFPAAKEDDD